MQPVEERTPFWGYFDLVVWLLLAIPSFLLSVLAVKAVFSSWECRPREWRCFCC
jgi:hypothetical protein